jgi:5'-nucleotidase
MNLAGLNYATFGNHEFDLSQMDFEQRVKESSFKWISSNVHGADGQPFMNVVPDIVITATNPSGRQFRIGVFGLTIDSNTATWVAYDKSVDTARRQFESLKGRADAVIALTHLAFEDDEAIAQALPGLAMILGGHEHLNMLARRGSGTVPIAKADANAKSVYIHRLRYDTDTRKLSIDSEWKAIDADIPDDPAVNAAVDRWRDAAFMAFRADGFDPPKQVTVLSVPLDGREETTRTGSTNLTELIADAMLKAFPNTDAAIFNSGSIRIDDELPAAPLTQYDVLRILPYPGNIMVARVSGAMLARIISVGHDTSHVGSGAYLQVAGLGNAPPDPKRAYRVVMNDFLLNGREAGLDFVAERGPAIHIEPDSPKELRHVVIDRLTRGS